MAQRTSGDDPLANPIFARAASASSRARRRRAAEVRDLLSDSEARLDERTRTAAGACLDAIVGALDRMIRARAATWLNEHGVHDSGATLATLSVDMTAKLADGGILSETALSEEVLGRVGEALLAERLPIDLTGDEGAGGLVLRLTASRDAKVSGAAHAFLAADAARRAEIDGEPSTGDLPSALRAHLAWPMVAILRGALPQDAMSDAALAHAASQVVGSIGEVHPLEATAMRLAKALAPDAEELPLLVGEALGDRRLSLATALIARALGTDYSAVRETLLDPEGERLWLVLRALDFDKPTIARIGWLLCEADARRSVEGFADQIDALMAVGQADAAAAIAELRLPHAYRDAIHLLRQRGTA
jgi:hypothetical protein